MFAVCSSAAGQDTIVGNWKAEVKRGIININDTTNKYPKFLRTAFKTINWTKKALYTYDTTYVEGFDNRWKFTVKCNNWFDSYSGYLTADRYPVNMMSDVTTKFGAHVSFKGFGLGYMLNIHDLVRGNALKNKRFDGSINTSRISLEWYYNKNRNEVNIHRLGDYGKHRWMTYKFSGLTREDYGLYLYYIFNHRKFCQSAAYGFSRHQRRSAGSLMVGFHFNRQDISIDFDELDEVMQDYLPDEMRDFRFYYSDYCLLLGYGYNWVPNQKWLINFTAIPNVGLRKSLSSAIEGRKYMFSTNMRFKLAAVINRTKWFYGLNIISDNHWFYSNSKSFFSSSHDFNIAVGIRL